MNSCGTQSTLCLLRLTFGADWTAVAISRPVGRFALPAASLFLYSQFVFPSWNPAQPEISDLVVQHDPKTLIRLPVNKSEIAGTFQRFANKKALRVIEQIPAKDGLLDPMAVDRLMLVVHWEMQRLAEEFYHGHRVLRIVRATIEALRSNVLKGPIRIVDVGCGIGYTIRWPAMTAFSPRRGHTVQTRSFPPRALPCPNSKAVSTAQKSGRRRHPAFSTLSSAFVQNSFHI